MRLARVLRRTLATRDRRAPRSAARHREDPIARWDDPIAIRSGGDDMTERNQHADGPAGRDEGHEPGLDSLEAFRGLAAAHALDAVDDDDRAAYERALVESPELRDEADRYAETAAQLAALAEPVEPPPALRQRLMS